MAMRKKEYIAYALLLMGALAVPLLQVEYSAGSEPDGWWLNVVRIWGRTVPYVLALAVHGMLIAPVLLEQRRTGRYVALVAILVAAFMGCAELTHRHCRPRPSGNMPPPREAYPPRTDRRDAARMPRPHPEMKDAVDRWVTPYTGIHATTIMDTLVAIMLLGCSMAAKLMLKRYEDMHRMELMEREHMRQELAQLKAQVSPHFFMNSLNNIHGMIETNPEQAQEMILELSGMMRYVLYESGVAMIPLTREIDFLCNYLALMRVRYSEEKVTIRYAFPDKADTAAIHIPPLLFIVLVENAFKHGVDYTKHSCVEVVIGMGESCVTMRCVNTTKAVGEAHMQGGVGLTNLRKRLDILYDDRYTLRTSEQDDLYSATLTIPYSYEHQMHRGG